MDLLEGDVELTEFTAMDVQSIKGVGHGANGFPFLIMKGVTELVAKGQRDCPKCSKNYDADHKGGKCENCGTDLPDADASKAADDKTDCPTCKGDGKIMAGKRDCPDCDATGKVTPEKAKTLASKSLVRAIIAKAVGGDGQVDEAPDVAGGTEVLARIADLIISEAQELKAGQAGEIGDILELACAAQAIWCWRTGEEAVASGSVMPATALMQSAAKAIEEVPDDLVALRSRIIDGLIKAKHSTADRKKLAEAGNALSDGSYPIADEHDLKSAAILAQSGHGDVEGAKRLIGRRAKELGVKNPLDGGGDTAKAAIATKGANVDTVTQGTGDLAKVVEDAVTKATAPLEERLKALGDELAKVKAAPVPGGPVLSRNVQVKQPGSVAREDWAAKAAYYRDMAEQVTDRPTADGYRKLAREADEKAVTPPAT
jgi:hypothetical protein